MDTGIIILLIILFIGTLCVVFQRPLVDFLFRYCSLGSLLDKLNGAFLSRDEKERLKQEREFRNAPPEELQTRFPQQNRERANILLAKPTKRMYYKKVAQFL